MTAFQFDPRSALELASIAYTQGRAAITQQLQDLPANRGGPWQLLWLGVDDANQVLLARSASAGLALAIRGSVTDPFSLAFWLDWFQQDLNAFDQMPFVHGHLPSDAKISRGTLDGIDSVAGMQDNGQDLLAALRAAGAQAALPVIGHSLGGGLATALAPWLEGVLGTPYWPLTFAAPAIGNEAFAMALASSYGSATSRFHNTLDVVPHAWAGLDWIRSSFPAGPTLPEVARLAIDAAQDYFHARGIRYRQPGPDQILKGTLQAGDSWAGEAGHQHATTTYRALLG